MLLKRCVSLASLAISALATFPANAAVPPAPDTLQPRVNSIAGSLTHFATRALIANRPLRFGAVPPNLLEEQATLLSNLKTLSRDPDQLHRLLNDPDPRARTIALGALFVREDPRDLPYIARLIDDRSSTIQDLHDSMNAAGGVRPPAEIESPQTVGQVASAMIRFYLAAAHVTSLTPANGNPVTESELLSAFLRYWAERKNRARCASWFLVKLERATRQSEAVPEQYRQDVDAVLAQIDSLPSPDREWTLLYALFGPPGPRPEHIVRGAALVYVAKAIGPADLMKFLLLEPFSSDPDLRFTQAEPRGEVFFPISAFILNHATQLLRPADAPVLRAHAFNNPQHFQGSTSLWIAASDWLVGIESPAKGAAKLKADFALSSPSSVPWSQQEQMRLAVDLWRLRGAAEKKFLVDWFYGLSPAQNPGLRQQFLRSVSADARPDTAELFTAIVADPRFDSANWPVLAQLLEAAGGGSSTPLLPSSEIYPYMPNQHRSDQEQVFASWRDILRNYYRAPQHPDSNVH